MNNVLKWMKLSIVFIHIIQKVHKQQLPTPSEITITQLHKLPHPHSSPPYTYSNHNYVPLLSSTPATTSPLLFCPPLFPSFPFSNHHLFIPFPPFPFSPPSSYTSPPPSPLLTSCPGQVVADANWTTSATQVPSQDSPQVESELDWPTGRSPGARKDNCWDADAVPRGPSSCSRPGWSSCCSAAHAPAHRECPLQSQFQPRAKWTSARGTPQGSVDQLHSQILREQDLQKHDKLSTARCFSHGGLHQLQLVTMEDLRGQNILLLVIVVTWMLGINKF